MPLVSSYKIKMLLLSMEGHLVMESLPPPMHADNISSNMGNMFFFRFSFHPAPGALVVYVLLWTSFLCCGRPWQASHDDFNSAEFSACEACAIYIGEASCGTVVMEIRWSLQPIVHVLAKNGHSAHSTRPRIRWSLQPIVHHMPVSIRSFLKVLRHGCQPSFGQ